MWTSNQLFTEEWEIQKAWTEGEQTYIEGWVSTNSLDTQKHRTEPEAFLTSLPAYFARNAPVSCEHNMRSFPVGHMQKAALIRDGKPFLEVYHPTDPAEFQHPPTTGTGWYGRTVINDGQTGAQIQKGNMSGHSWTGRFKSGEPLPGGGMRITGVEPLLETTVAAYPVDTNARFQRIQKAYSTQEERDTMNPEQLEELLAKALEKRDAEREAKRAAKKENEELTLMKAENAALKQAVEEMKTRFEAKLAEMDTELQKAKIPQRGEGVGTRATRSDEELRDENPASYLLSKAATPEKFDHQDKDLVAEMTKKLLTDGMQYGVSRLLGSD